MGIRIIFVLLSFLWVMPATAEQPGIKIGLSLSITGKYAAMGNMQRNGFELWKKHVNSGRKLLGREVEMIIRDDQSNSEAAKSIYLELIEKEKVDLVFGPYSSEISEAILPITEQHHYPVLLSGASADELWSKGYRYAFGVYSPASKYAVGFLEMLVRNKINDIAIVSADDSFSASLFEGTRNWAKKFQINIRFSQRFAKGTGDMVQLAEKVKQSEAQALLVCGHLQESVDMRKALKSINWYPRAYYASVGPATRVFQEILGGDAELVFSSSQWEEQVGVHFPGGKTFITTFKETYGQAPSYHAATAYAAGMILEEALKILGRVDRDGLRDTLSIMDTMTVIGRYGVDKTGWQIRHFPLIIQWQQKELKVVWPPKLKQAEPVIMP